MKAIQEKRISLRLLWRMGLVILSIFALAFAACGSSDSGDNGTPPPGPSLPGYPNVPVPPKSVIAISVVKNPSGVSWQGCEPNLEGLEVYVTYSDGKIELVKDTTLFFTDPLRIDRVLQGTSDRDNDDKKGEKDVWDPVYVFHKDGRSIKQQIILPKVRELDRVQLTGAPIKKTYFEDDRIDFTGTVLMGWYKADGDLDTPNRVIPMSLANENWYTLDPMRKLISYKVAEIDEDNDWTVDYKITDFFPVERIEYLEGADNLPVIIADDVDVGGTSVLDRKWWLEQFRVAEIKFTVYYLGTTETKVKTMEDYIYALTNRKKAIYPTIPVLVDANAELAVTSRLLYYDSMLSDDPEWVPPSAAWVNSAIVPIPVYVFAEEIELVPTANNKHEFVPQVFWGTGTQAHYETHFWNLWTINYLYTYKDDVKKVKVPPSRVTFAPINVTDPLEDGEIEVREITITVMLPDGSPETLEHTYIVLP